MWKEYKMNAKETMLTWKWRLAKAGVTAKKLCEELGIDQSQFSQYVTGKQTPSLERFDLIEGKLKSLGV